MFEQKQIQKLQKKLNQVQQEHRREKSVLLQKIDLLNLQISDYQEKQCKSRVLNESILMSYKQNQSFQNQFTQKQLNAISQKHQEEIKSMKKRHLEQKKRLEDQVNHFKAENDKLKLDIERINLEHEKQIAQLKSTFEEQIQQKDNDMNNIFQHRLDLMNERLVQSEDMNMFYKNQLETKKIRQSIVLKQSKQKGNATIQEISNYPRRTKLEGESVTALNLRINRALVQLNPNRYKLSNQIKKIKQRIYDN